MSGADAAVASLTREEIDTYPAGVIRLDRRGTILQYNRAEASLAKRDAAATLGRNFFTDVAPCAAVRDFQGRFTAFAAGRDTGIEKFDFVFRFAWGAVNVAITFVRKAGEADVFLMVVKRDEAPGR